MRNALRAQLKQGQVAFGMIVGIGSPEVSYALGDVGIDWITFDTQHAILDMRMIAGMIQAMSYSKTVPIVRVQSNDLGLINKALDIGAQAVVVPLVNTREDAGKSCAQLKIQVAWTTKLRRKSLDQRSRLRLNR